LNPNCLALNRPRRLNTGRELVWNLENLDGYYPQSTRRPESLPHKEERSMETFHFIMRWFFVVLLVAAGVITYFLIKKRNRTE
jgi:hypothetical protein